MFGAQHRASPLHDNEALVGCEVDMSFVRQHLNASVNFTSCSVMCTKVHRYRSSAKLCKVLEGNVTLVHIILSEVSVR